MHNLQPDKKQMNQIDVLQLLQQMEVQLKQRIQTIDADKIFMVGIHTGGYWLAQHLHQSLNLQQPLGGLNISFYRDDFTRIGLHPKVQPSELPVDTDDMHIILVDDVLHTGRTVRAALNEIFDYGRPASVLFCCLIDRMQHELPICADIYGLKLDLPVQQQIKLNGPQPLSLSVMDMAQAQRTGGDDA